MRFIVALTGASGALYALRLLEQLVAQKHRVELILSEPACVSIAAETDLKLSAHHLDIEKICPGGTDFITAHNPRDIGASVASGRVRHDGMILVPCAMGTRGRIAQGLRDLLISRAADVTLKERRKLLLVTREMPLSLLHLRNMVSVTEAGALVFHACPHFYHRPQSVIEVVDTVIDRVLDHLDVEIETRRWKELQ